MNSVRTIAQIGIIIVFYLAGEAIVNVTGIFVPGSIIGLVLLWLVLYFKLLNVKYIQTGASFLLAFLTLFFIPSTVGVINYPELLTLPGVLLMLAVVVSTLFTIVVTGKVSKYIEKKEVQLKEESQVASISTNSVHRH